MKFVTFSLLILAVITAGFYNVMRLQATESTLPETCIELIVPVSENKEMPKSRFVILSDGYLNQPFNQKKFLSSASGLS